MLRDLVALELDAAFGRRNEPEQRAAERRLAAPRLTDESEDLTAVDVERDVVDGLHASGFTPDDPLSEAPADRVVGLEALDGDEDVVLPRQQPRSRLLGDGDLLSLERRVTLCRDLVGRTVQPAKDTPSAVEPVSIGASTGAHLHRTLGHRGWKRHPVGGSIRFGGAPGIECSSIVSSEMVERRSSCVYGCAGSLKTERASPSSTI